MSVIRRPRRAAATPTLWSDNEIQALIDERRNRNWDYWYGYPGRSRVSFWQSVADAVNGDCGSNYTGTQCKRKFASLVKEYNVSKINKEKCIFFILICLICFNTFNTFRTKLN